MINLIPTWAGFALFFTLIWTIFQWIDGWPLGRRVAATWAGWILGGILGSGMGIASAGEGIPAEVLLAPLFAWIGFLIEPTIYRK